MNRNFHCSFKFQLNRGFPFHVSFNSDNISLCYHRKDIKVKKNLFVLAWLINPKHIPYCPPYHQTLTRWKISAPPYEHNPISDPTMLSLIQSPSHQVHPNKGNNSATLNPISPKFLHPCPPQTTRIHAQIHHSSSPPPGHHPT